MRIEEDSIGSLVLEDDVYYGVQTLRAHRNFPITGRQLHPAFIMSLATIKKAAAVTNMQAGVLDRQRGEAILAACDELIDGNLHDQFIVDPIQGGAGTSANMNANEVIANRAIELLGGRKGDYTLVNPNDHVNMAQSTNDVYPTAGKLTVLELLPRAISQLIRLQRALESKAEEFHDVIKMGRTQLQDAVPMRLGQSFAAYAAAVARDVHRLEHVQEEMRTVNIGGTAIGTAINVCPDYLSHIAENLAHTAGTSVRQAENLIDATQNADGFVMVSGVLKTCAVNLSKMANDLRLLSSGPRTGVREINLPAQQPGSSIMPGKVNPVIPEVVTQVAFLIIGHDHTVTMAAEAGQLELNAFEPIIFFSLFESIEALEGAVRTFVDNCVLGITADRERCRELLEHSVGTVTALCPYIGYKKAAELAKRALHSNIPVSVLALDEKLVSEEVLRRALNPATMTEPHYA